MGPKCTLVFMYSTLHSCLILMNLHFLTDFFKNTQISNFVKIRPVEAELFHADRRTDITKL